MIHKIRRTQRLPKLCLVQRNKLDGLARLRFYKLSHLPPRLRISAETDYVWNRVRVLEGEKGKAGRAQADIAERREAESRVDRSRAGEHPFLGV